VASLVQSVATVTFTGPPVFALVFGLVGIVAVLSESDEADRDGGGAPRARPAAVGAASARSSSG
jgi:hypothetical protein